MVTANNVTGISWLNSLCTIDDIKDGTSNTYMIGEKYLNPTNYDTGADGADNESMYSGYENHNHRSSNGILPYRDRIGLANADAWGSAHASCFNVVLCDGSVRAISFSIDADTHKALGSRSGSEVIEASKL